MDNNLIREKRIAEIRKLIDAADERLLTPATIMLRGIIANDDEIIYQAWKCIFDMPTENPQVWATEAHKHETLRPYWERYLKEKADADICEEGAGDNGYTHKLST